MVLQYKCQNCGADMAFDAKSGMLSCKNCGNTLSIEAYQKASETPVQDFDQFEEQTFTGAYEENAAAGYQCQNCGAVLITDSDTIASSCSYCGAPMILSDRMSGVFAPAKIIPFSIPKEEAQSAFRKWCRGGLITPKGFASAERIQDIHGMYIPFWLYDLNGQGEANAECTRTRTYESGDYIYTETSYYDVYRKVDLNYLKVPVDASEKMEDGLMDKLEPFHYSNLKDFKMPYLSGYLAEKYNYTDKDLFPRAKQRIEQYIQNYIQSTISGYSSVRFRRQWSNVRQRAAYYTLLPVWMISYNYNNKNYMFAMNGQTGKIVGSPPLSAGKIVAWLLGIGSGSFLILELLSILVRGGLS